MIFLSPKVSFGQVENDAEKLDFARILTINGNETKAAKKYKINVWKSTTYTLLITTYEMFAVLSHELEIRVHDVIIVDEAHKTLSHGTKSCNQILYQGVTGKTIFMSGIFLYEFLGR